MTATRSRIRLVTRGRRTGAGREVTLYAFSDGDTGRLVIVGSHGGAARDPQWVGNLRADPAAVVREGRDERPVVAREIEGGERARLWAVVTATTPMYAGFEGRTRRQIPLFVLEPVPGR